ncbi:MAG: PKD repeat protein [Flavobacteriales bacterium]|jgi:PKD repeat protein
MGVLPMPEPSYVVSPEVVTTRIDAEFTYTGTDGVAYDWELGYGAESTMIHPVGEYKIEGVYPISLTVTSEHNCVTIIEDELTVELAPALFVPNALVPNGSWANRHYRVGGVGLTTIEFVITDRWGTEI